MVSLAAKLHWGMFILLCETAIIAHHRDKIEEAIRDAMRLEQEHDYYYNHESEDNDTDSNTTRSARNTTKLH